MKTTSVKHAFVESFPTQMQAGTVYVSIPFATVGHLCCCGCGEEVITPLSPARWRLEYDGRSISLRPSIGNWNLPCRSHYWITDNAVRWAEDWSDAKIARAIAADQRLLDSDIESDGTKHGRNQTAARGWLAALKSRLGRSR